MVCATGYPILCNSGSLARPAAHPRELRSRGAVCLARSSAEYPSSSWPRGRVDKAATSVQVHALASTLMRETEAAASEGLSEADLMERRRLLEGSYLAETAPEPVRLALRKACYALKRDGKHLARCAL